jgi:hypothetical protein
MDMLEAELNGILLSLRRRQDIVPFMDRLISISEIDLRPLPVEMYEVIRQSPDFRELIAGQPPTILQIEAEQGHLELLIYRAVADDSYHIAAPRVD